MAVPLWRLKMTKIKTLRATDGWTDGWTNGITLRGPRGPKKDLLPGGSIINHMAEKRTNSLL